jgi:hypothetical protein
MERIVNYSDLKLLKFEQEVFNKKLDHSNMVETLSMSVIFIIIRLFSNLDSLNAKFQLFKFRKYSINNPKENSKTRKFIFPHKSSKILCMSEVEFIPVKCCIIS